MKTNIRQSIRPLLLATALACVPLGASAASASELLEKGIYTEETKGDLDSAIAIYQQIVADAKAAQTLAAQAQYRLGLCYQKKNRTAEATAAFEKLVHDFPGEKDLVAKAREHLPADLALLPVPWVDGERLQLTITVGAGQDIGTTEYRAMLGEEGGRRFWQVGARMFANANSVSSVSADPATFQPHASFWKHAFLGEAEASYRPGEIGITRPGKDEVKIASDKTLYDNEQAMHLMRRLPLAVGYKTVIPLISSLGASAPIALGLEVPAVETVEVPAGRFECFKVALSIGQTFYFSTDAHRYLVKFEAGNVAASLVSIAQRAANAPVPFRNDALGITFTAPPNWVVHLRANDKPGRETIYMLDPDALAQNVLLQLNPIDDTAAHAPTDTRAWAEESLKNKATRERKDIKVRPASWKSVIVSGRTGTSFTADYLEKDRPMVLHCLHALGAKTSEQFVLDCPAEDFDALLPAFAQIVASYRAK